MRANGGWCTGRQYLMQDLLAHVSCGSNVSIEAAYVAVREISCITEPMRLGESALCAAR